MQELRKYRRVSYRGQVLINNLVTAPGISLGEGGLFVGTKYLFKPGSEIDVEFSVGGDIIKNARAGAAWAEQYRNGNDVYQPQRPSA
jgi:hypothetical protein